MRVRVLVPHRAMEFGVRSSAGDILDLPAEVAEILLERGAAEQTAGSVGPFVAPEPTGVDALTWEELFTECRSQGIEGIEGIDRMSAAELRATLRGVILSSASEGPVVMEEAE